MKQGFDERIVLYEHIHSISPEDSNKLIDAIDPKAGEIILDAMCGYGAVTKGVLERESNAKLFLLDESEVQLNRAKENLQELPVDRFILSELPTVSFSHVFFDKIVVKMGLHEVPYQNQIEIAKSIYRLLKPGGKLIIWDIFLNYDNQHLFQNIIRKKDELSGFDLLTKERYFFTEEEFLTTVRQGGFNKIQDFHTINYRFSSLKRLESELHNEKSRLEQLNSYIREVFPESLKSQMKYDDAGDDIQFDITKKIFVIKK